MGGEPMPSNIEDGQLFSIASWPVLLLQLLIIHPAMRPLPEGVVDNGVRYSIAQRAQVLALVGENMPLKYVAERTKIPVRTVRNIVAKAKQLGFNPAEDSRVLDHYVVNQRPTGRPKVASGKADRASREKSSEGYLSSA